MKKLLVLVFVASAMLACSKKQAPQTTPPPADQKMEGEAPKTEGTETPTEGGDQKPEGGDPCGGGAADPCAPPK
jgi:hypothetical protein